MRAQPTYWLRRDADGRGWRLGLIGWAERVPDTVCRRRGDAADIARRLAEVTGLPVAGVFVPPRPRAARRG